MAKLYSYRNRSDQYLEHLEWHCYPGLRFDGITLRNSSIWDTEYIDMINQVAATTGGDIGVSFSPWYYGEYPNNPKLLIIEDIDAEFEYITNICKQVVNNFNISYVLIDYEKWESTNDIEANRIIGIKGNLVRSLIKSYFPDVTLYHYAEIVWRAGDVGFHWNWVDELHTEITSCALYWPTHPDNMSKIFDFTKIRGAELGKEVIPTVTFGAGYGHPDNQYGFTSPWDYPLEYSRIMGELVKGHNVIVYPAPYKSFDEQSIQEKHLHAFLQGYRDNYHISSSSSSSVSSQSSSSVSSQSSSSVSSQSSSDSLRKWIGLDSSHLFSYCGGDIEGRLNEALDGEIPFWVHSVIEPHWMIIDLEDTYNIHSIRCRSKSPKNPIDIQCYVSDDTSSDSWGDPIGSWWGDFANTTSWVERSVTPKAGRYVKLVINKTTAGPDSAMIFGIGEDTPFFDIYVSPSDSKWLNVTCGYIHSYCGEDSSGSLADAIDGNASYWVHNMSEKHWFILDLFETYNIEKIRCRSKSSKDPVEIQCYVSDDINNWETAVGFFATEFSNTEKWVERPLTPKIGRYLKLEILGTKAGYNGPMIFGVDKDYTPFFDVYVTPVSSSSSKAIDNPSWK